MDFQVISQLGQSKFKVYHVYSPSIKTHYALKSFPKDSQGTKCYLREISFSNLSHPNVIRFVPIPEPDSLNQHAILTEFTEHGDFFNLATKGIVSSEIIIRSYFHQLIEGLEYLHSQGISHLDLKLENLLLGADFKLKIIDFDQSQHLAEKSLMTSGTPDFRAPEMISGACEDFMAADIYSAGIILYACRAQEYPFQEVIMKCSEIQGSLPPLRHYREFMQKNDSFWRNKAFRKGDFNFFSKEFKELINGMLELDVKKRFTLEDVIKSRWYQGDILNQENLEALMKKKLRK